MNKIVRDWWLVEVDVDVEGILFLTFLNENPDFELELSKRFRFDAISSISNSDQPQQTWRPIKPPARKQADADEAMSRLWNILGTDSLSNNNGLYSRRFRRELDERYSITNGTQRWNEIFMLRKCG